MALSTFQKAALAVAVIVTIIILHVLTLRAVNHEYKAVLRRAEFVVGIETFMTMLSIMIWRSLRPCLGPSGTVSGRDRVEGNHQVLGNNQQSLWKDKTPTRSSNIFTQQCFNKGRVSFLQILLLVFLFLAQISYLTNIIFIGKEPHWFGMLAYSCLGAFTQLATGVVMANFLSMAKNTLLKLAVKKSTGLSQKFVAFTAISYALLSSVVGLYVASQPPTIRNVKIPVNDLPHNLEGLTIVQISDIHLGPTVGFTKLNTIVDMINAQEPDVVVLTGDLVDGSVKSLKAAAEPLSRVTSKYGNFFVSGNHEYYTGDVDNWFSYLRSLTFTVLHNSNVRVPARVSNNEGQICFAGTDDIQADSIGYKDHGFDISSAVEGCSNHPVVLLAHQPKAAKQALDSGHRIDLVLSGHTHGGQIFPLLLGAYYLNPFYLGLYSYGSAGSHVYVSEGTQFWGIPMRIGTSMEITRITLTRAVTV